MLRTEWRHPPSKVRTVGSMKAVKIILGSVAVLMFIGFLKPALHQLFQYSIRAGLGGGLIAFGVAFVVTILMHHPTPVDPALPESEEAIRQSALGSVTFIASKVKFWFLAIAGGGMTAACIFVIVVAVNDPKPDASIGVAVGIFGSLFFGSGVVAGVVGLFPGANLLRLDEAGFEVTSLFRKKTFGWSQVSDFAVSTYGGSQKVVFRVAKPNLNLWERIKVVSQDGRVGWLPDTYGFSAQNLARYLITWQVRAGWRRSRNPPLERRTGDDC
jgi:hypothetical protein